MAGASSVAAVGIPCSNCNPVKERKRELGLRALAANLLSLTVSTSENPQIAAPYAAVGAAPTVKIRTARFPMALRKALILTFL